MNTIWAVVLGGAFGALARHGVSFAGFKMLGSGFPWATLFVNVFGSCLMGALIGVFAHFWQPSPEIKAFLVTGFLGAFTTFSAFSLEAVTLYERGELLLSGLYIAASVILSIAALFAALYLVRAFAS